eukprot:gene9093-10063_t
MTSNESDQLPYTERENVITSNIDVAEVDEIIELIQRTEEEIFQKWYNNEAGLLNSSILNSIDNVAERVAQLMNEKCDNVKVIFSGCGTSGRLGFICCKRFNEICKKINKAEIFDYIISGQDIALLQSTEAEEDDAFQGRKYLTDLTEIICENSQWFIIATFVASQIELANELQSSSNCNAALIGFNPIKMAKNVQVKNGSFNDVISEMLEHHGILINPVVGAEPIAGSSRMKGGTATKIILDTMFFIALSKCLNKNSITPEQSIKNYEATLTTTQAQKMKIAQCIKHASDSLLSNGHVYYIGLNSSGYFGILDASECVPTFGAKESEIKGFLKGGFQMLGNRQGNISNEVFDISLSYFKDEIMPHVSINDFIIIYGDVSNVQEMKSLKESLDRRSCQVAFILISSDIAAGHKDSVAWQELLDSDKNIYINPLMTHEAFEDSQIQDDYLLSMKELCLKRIFNIISTGAYIVNGKVWKNIMIDLKVSNDKLLNRAISIIYKFTDCSKEEVVDYLLKAMYQTNDLTDEMKQVDKANLVKIGCHLDNVVPTAMLLATGLHTIESAQNVLKNEKVIRKCLLKDFHQLKH